MIRQTLVAAALVLGLTLFGCVSTPKPKSPDSSLILIPTSIDNTSGATFARNYFVQLSDGYGEFPISDFRDTYIMVVVENPGVRIIGIRSVVDRSKNFEGPDGFNKVDIPLPYKAGQVVVSDVSLKLSMIRIDAQNYSSGVQPIKTSPEKVNELMELLRKNVDNAVWFKE